VLCASVHEIMLSSFLCVFLIGEFHQEFQPEPSLLGDSNNSGQEGDQFVDGPDVLHSGFISYIKAGFLRTNQFFYPFSPV
jgi:hypothetical protein